MPGHKSKEIYQTEISKRIDIKTGNLLSEDVSEKKFRWSASRFKFVERYEKIEK